MLVNIVQVTSGIGNWLLLPICRGIAQLVEHWSPKPSVVGSSPTAPAKHVTVVELEYTQA